MCKHGDTVPLLVTVPASDAHEGVDTIKQKPIDRCIAPIVAALNGYGVLTRSSCCGHNKGDGWIMLQDGRKLRVEAAQ